MRFNAPPLGPQNIVEDTGASPHEVVVPLSNVTGPVLAKVIEYATWRVTEASSKNEEEQQKWENDFADVDQDTLFDLILVGAVHARESVEAGRRGTTAITLLCLSDARRRASSCIILCAGRKLPEHLELA